METGLLKVIEANFVVVVFGGVITVALLTSCIKSVVASLARERSRREIAAYIAERAMTPEEGERLMTAGSFKKGSC